jgi:hypothetical protein
MEKSAPQLSLSTSQVPEFLGLSGSLRFSSSTIGDRLEDRTSGRVRPPALPVSLSASWFSPHCLSRFPPSHLFSVFSRRTESTTSSFKNGDIKAHNHAIVASPLKVTALCFFRNTFSICKDKTKIYFVI